MSTLHSLSGLAGVLGVLVFAAGLVALPVAAGRLPRWLLPLVVVAAAFFLITAVLGLSPLQ